MGMIHINRNRQSLGQFSEQEVADGLKSGEFLPDDLAWREPMESWQPLSTFTGLPPASEDVGPVPATPQETECPVSPDGIAPVWEYPEPPPLFPAMVETAKQVLTKPVETFQAMPAEGGFAKPFKFYVLIAWITGAVGILYQAVATIINPEMFLKESAAVHLSQMAIVSIFIGVVFLLPLFLFFEAFIGAALLHGALMLMGGATKSFETTFRVFCYASGSTSVLQLVPLCGRWVYLAASLVYCVVGLKEAHHTDLWRPLVAALILILFCCGMFVGSIMLIAWIGYSAIGAAAAPGK